MSAVSNLPNETGKEKGASKNREFIIDTSALMFLDKSIVFRPQIGAVFSRQAWFRRSFPALRVPVDYHQ